MKIEMIPFPDDAQIDLQNRGWEKVGRFFRACVQLYLQSLTETDYIQNRLAPGMSNIINEAFPEFDGGLTISIKPKQ